MRNLFLVLTGFACTAALAAPQAAVQVEPTHSSGPRQLESETRAAAIRDYLQSWQAFRFAFAQDQASLLDADFIGNAQEKLAATIREQAELGIETKYRDFSHNIRIVFNSPEGLSIELTDDVGYEVQVFDHGKPAASRDAHARYLVVLTPSQVRWKVRVFQAIPE